jgi:rhodanese-related sulfurtransferase
LKSKTSLLIVSLILMMQLFVACSPAAPATERVSINVLVRQAFELRENGAMMLDVRTVEEWNDVHLPGATLIPLEQLAGRVSEVPTDVPVVIYCRSGNRSHIALRILQNAGFTDVHNMIGGINAWRQAGLPTE